MGTADAPAREINRLAHEVREGSIGLDAMTGSTITVTSIGPLGVESGTAIINYPEAAILAPGAIVSNCVEVRAAEAATVCHREPLR